MRLVAARAVSARSVPVSTTTQALAGESGAAASLRAIPGAVDLYADRTTGSPYLEMTVDRIHGLVFSGGSTFGLDAATGVQAALREDFARLPGEHGDIRIGHGAVPER